MALLSIVVMTSFVLMEKGKRDKAFTDMWVKYYNAEKKDRIQDMADILEDIKTMAFERKSAVDFFRACDEYVNVKSRRNWKLTDSLIARTSEELHEYGVPSLEIYFGLRHGEPTDSLIGKVKKYADVMMESEHTDMYEFYGHEIFDEYEADRFNRLMVRSIDDDYEFIMWSLLAARGYSCEWVYGELADYLDGAYPAVPYIDYLKLRNETDGEVRKKELEKIAREYAGRGIGTAAEDELILMRFNAMEDKSTSEEYRELEKDIEIFEAERKALRGEEAAVAEIHMTSSDILETLRGKEAAVRIENGECNIAVRNSKKVKFVVMKGEEPVFETVVLNDEGSFYKWDTLKVNIPVLDDGEYMTAVYDGSKEMCRYEYEKFTISVARRLAGDGMCIYAADYMTGEPVNVADLVIYNGKEKVAESGGFTFDGFTELPKEIYPFRDKKGYRLVCRYEKEGILHSSKPMYMNNKELALSRSEQMLCARVVKDRAAFVPGDTVRFKVFMYVEHPEGSRVTVPEGEEVIVEIEDPSENVVSKMILKTNEFGTASGSFAVDGKGRNGRWAIWVRNEKYAVEPSYFRVDEFQLPSYDLTFNEAEKLYFPGDEVSVSGKVMSYSGHGLGGLKASAFIYVNHEFVGEKAVSIASDGSFRVSFVAGEAAEDYVNYRVEMRLTDNTGETFEFYWNSDVSKGIDVRARLLNPDSGSFTMEIDEGPAYLSRTGGEMIFSSEIAEVKCWVSVRGGEMPGIPMSYELRYGATVVRGGSVMSGDVLALDMKGLASGLYELELKAAVTAPDGKDVTSSEVVSMLYMPKGEDVVPCEVDRMFRTSYEDGNIIMQLGSGTGPLWAVVELFGKDYVPLKKMTLRLEGGAGKAGSLVTLTFPHLDGYSDKVSLSVFYFRNGGRVQLQETFIRPKTRESMPLEFSSFVDKAFPGQEISMKMKTSPDAEALVSVFDASSQKIALNTWERLRFGEPDYPVSVYYSSSVGCDKTERYLIAYGTGRKSARVGKNLMVSGDLAYDSVSDGVGEEAIPFQMAESKASFMDVAIRDDFAATLAFEPFLRPSSDGTVELKFRTSGKLSTFIVKAMAHDKSMNTAFADKEMVVNLPVRVSVMEPQYLYEGDKYVLNASVSNASGAMIEGKVCLEIYDGDKYVGVTPLKESSAGIEVPAGGSVSVGFQVDVPEGMDSLGFKIVFTGHECASEGIAANDVLISDGMFVPVPVYPAAQILTESHSAVLLGGQSAEELLERLRSEFVNVSSAGAEYEEISIMDMIREALPVAYETDGKDAVSLSESVFMNFMAADLHAGDEAAVRKCVAAAMGSVERLLTCANPDGGFAWFEGMPSSPIVTALVLERYAGLSDRRMLDVAQLVWGEDSLDDLDFAVLEAVKYLDSSYFGDSERPFWYGRLSLGQYLNVRSMFAGVDFDEGAARKAVGKKGYREFQKAVRAYLIPKEVRTGGDVLSKVRTVRVINALLDGTQEGGRISRSWGLGSAADVKKMLKSRSREMESLKQYAVEHPSGGIYYPNAVMPWRGLLESEAYAHAQICNLAKDMAGDEVSGMDRVAEGIRIWLMLQKETQEWSSDPGFVEALASVYDGSSVVKDTRVLVLKKRYSKSFDEIKASGNGFKVSVDYYMIGEGGARTRLADGDLLHVGDKITAVYSLWSEENRSHVRLSAPRAACFRPVEQLSGWSGGWFRPLMYGSRYVSPYSYREVKADRTLWWIDVFPEEKTVIEEELFVTQEGVFTAPVAEIESLYAPHYRANDSGHSLFRVL